MAPVNGPAAVEPAPSELMPAGSPAPVVPSLQQEPLPGRASNDPDGPLPEVAPSDAPELPSNVPGVETSDAPSSAMPSEGNAPSGGPARENEVLVDVEGEALTPNVSCTFEIDAELSDAIGSVGIISFSTDLGVVDAGYVEFGLDETYGARAPLDTAAAGHRSLLLGMRQAAEYHYRIVARAGDEVCASDDGVITTGTAPQGIPTVNVETPLPEQVAHGFIITSSGGNGSGAIVIYDHHGELVWWFQASIGGISRARIDWDGKYIYARDGNPGGGPGGQVVRVAIDGSSEETVTVDTGHHDMSAADDGMLFLTGQGRDNCSKVEKLSRDDELSLVYDLRDAFDDDFEGGGNDPCHCNSIHYNPDDNSITVSCLTQNAYVKITGDGQLAWVLGGNGSQSHFTGDVTWNRQHGHHMTNPNRILFFNNNGLTPGAGGGDFGGGGSDTPSLAVELELDLEQMVATRIRTYEGGPSSQTLGDVQQLHNGNILVTYSNSGEIHEVDPKGNLVQAYTFANGTGYANHRASLYGAPPAP